MEKIAIIDLGSNSARLVIANIMDGGYFSVIDELKEPVRLAQDMEIDGFLRPVRVAQTIKTLRTFRTLYESHNVDKVFAYATAAVRKAKNQKSFIEEVQTSCGIKLTVLSQEEEALFVYYGVINSMDVPKGLIIDIGGGSVKLIYYNRRVLIAQDTLPFGAVTLTEKFARHGSPEECACAIEKYVTEHLAKLDWLKNLDPETQFIGVGTSASPFHQQSESVIFSTEKPGTSLENRGRKPTSSMTSKSSFEEWIQDGSFQSTPSIYHLPSITSIKQFPVTVFALLCRMKWAAS